MPFLKRESQEEKDFKLKVKLAELKKKTEEYAGQCERLSRNFEQKAAEASKIDNRTLARNFASKSLQFEIQAKRAKSFLLIISDLEMSKEQQTIMNSISSAMKDFLQAVGNGKINSTWAASLSVDIDKAVDESVRMDGYFGDFLDTLSSQAIAATNLSDEEISKKLNDKSSSRGGDAGASFNEEELDKRIEKGLKRLSDSKQKVE
jgi:hypothetical protein